jgi:trimeric autotransporter adhesin
MKALSTAILALVLAWFATGAFSEDPQYFPDPYTLRFDATDAAHLPPAANGQSIFYGGGGRLTQHGGGLQGYYNVGVGPRSLRLITTGSYNTFGGYESGEGCTTCTRNTGFGEATQVYSQTANDNTTIGWKAMMSKQGLGPGDENIAVGTAAMQTATENFRDIDIGPYALGGANYTGDDNIAIGKAAGYDCTICSRNIFIAPNAGRGIKSGNFSVII